MEELRARLAILEERMNEPQGIKQKKDIAAYVAIGITLVGALLAGSMRFEAIESRVNAIETVQANNTSKLDTIASAVARIEGRLIEQDKGRK